MLEKLLKIEDNWVIFFDLFSKSGNGDSVYPVAQELRKRRPDMKFFFCTNPKNKKDFIEMADEILVEKSLRFKYVCAKAKYMVSPMGFPRMKKRKGQVLVQTWHGSPLKKLYLSKDAANKKYLKYTRNFRDTDMFCSQGDFHNGNLAEAFNLKSEQIMNTGVPRNDILFSADEKFKTDLKKELGLPCDKKVLFYCPTWRRYDRKSVLPFDLQALKEKLGDKYCILIRSHVGKHIWVDENNKQIKLFDNEFSFDGGNYPEVTHLYLISDVLISDYSSSIFDFAITGKPQIFYAYDLEEYEAEFGLYFNYKDFIIGDLCTNTAELTDAVISLDQYDEKYRKKYKTFQTQYLPAEKGTASKQVVDFMLNGAR